jgi:hypothetical protein
MALRIEKRLAIPDVHLRSSLKILHREIVVILFGLKQVEAAVVGFKERHVRFAMCGGCSDSTANLGVCSLHLGQRFQRNFVRSSCEGYVVPLRELPS